MSIIKKLKDAFTDFLKPDPLIPENDVCEKLLEQGWKIQFNYLASPECAFVIPASVKRAVTPDGAVAIGENPDEKAFEAYKAALAQARRDMGRRQP